jgi:hypothetical protein
MLDAETQHEIRDFFSNRVESNGMAKLLRPQTHHDSDLVKDWGLGFPNLDFPTADSSRNGRAIRIGNGDFPAVV